MMELDARSVGMHLRRWLLILLVPLAAAAAVLAIVALQGRADDARRQQTVLADIASEVNSQDALEWETVAKRELTAESARELDESRDRIESRFETLALLAGEEAAQVKALGSPLEAYQAAVDEEFALLGARRFEAAERVDEERVDPAFEGLDDVLAEIRIIEDDRATSATFRAALGTVASLALATILLLAVFALLARTRGQVIQERQRQLEHDASHDFLTGLPNRRRLIADLERVLRRSDEAEPGLLIMFDLDGFKNYNDSFGHPEGDLLLRRLSTKLAAALDGVGTAYRLGGDEFCALIGTSGHDPQQIVQLCASALAEDGEGFRIRTSSGYALIPAEASDATAALLLADHRMYQHKDGRPSSAKQQTRDLVLRVLAERQPEVHHHANTVASITRPVAERLGFQGAELDDVIRAAELHDIGKIAIPDAILYKPGPLDDEEWRFMRRHTVIGEKMLCAASSLVSTAKLVRSSHERLDGEGYPDGLRGEEIPLGSRIIFVCDAFEAMTSTRPYQSALGEEAALAELRRCAGTQFDPVVVDVLPSALEDILVSAEHCAA